MSNKQRPKSFPESCDYTQEQLEAIKSLDMERIKAAKLTKKQLLWVLQCPDGWKLLTDHKKPVSNFFTYSNQQAILNVITEYWSVLSDVVNGFTVKKQTVKTCKTKLKKKKLLNLSTISFMREKLKPKDSVVLLLNYEQALVEYGQGIVNSVDRTKYATVFIESTTPAFQNESVDIDDPQGKVSVKTVARWKIDHLIQKAVFVKTIENNRLDAGVCSSSSLLKLLDPGLETSAGREKVSSESQIKEPVLVDHLATISEISLGQTICNPAIPDNSALVTDIVQREMCAEETLEPHK